MARLQAGNRHLAFRFTLLLSRHLLYASLLCPSCCVQNWGEYMTEATFNWRMVKVNP